MDYEHRNELLDALIRAKRVFVFTGAGASKESGLPTFRDLDGEWRKHDPMTFATFEGFMDHPVAVWNMYRLRQRQIAQAQPNPGHIALAQMEQHYPEFFLCTQNVDDLHERAGSVRMVKLHGDAWQMRCVDEGDVFDVRDFDLPDEFTLETLPHCPDCGGLCRPNIVWFGEIVPPEPMIASIESASTCDLMLIVGTSGEVSNGYGLAHYALQNRAIVVEINPAASALTRYVHIWLPEPAGQALPRICSEMLDALSGA